MLSRNIFGVDLGTSAIKVYSQRKRRLLVEKNMIAIRNRSQVIAVGNDAFEMFEKNPPNIVIDRPLADGRIANVDEVEMLLKILLKRTDHRVGMNPVIYFSVPVNMSEIDKRAYYAVCNSGSFYSPKVYLVDRPICDAIALGIPISRTEGSMILSLGAQSSKMSVISGGQVIISNSINTGGQQLNQAICEELRRSQNLLVGTRTARRLKAVLANLDHPADEARKVFGIDTLSGLPREAIVTSEEISAVVESEMLRSADTVRSFLERIPPQVASFVREEGIFLTGGTARIPGIGRYLSKAVDCPVRLSGDYELTTVRGLEKVIKHKEFKRWVYTIKDRK